MVFTTFKRYGGLYFWSLLIASWGIAPHTVGFILKFFRIISVDWVAVAMVGIGWWAMVTGQSMVLYSRLHLVVHDQRWLRWVLYLIIFDAIGFGIPLLVMAFGANSSNPAPFVGIYTIWDKLQIVVFFVQEFGISVLYIYATIKLLKPAASISQGALRKLLAHLIVVNIVVLIFDITLLATQFTGHFEIQTSYKAAIYSVKLKIEFSVLNRLIDIVQHKNHPLSSVVSYSTHSTPYFIPHQISDPSPQHTSQGSSYRPSFPSETKSISTFGAARNADSVHITEIEDSGARSPSSFTQNVDIPLRAIDRRQLGVSTVH